MITPTALADLNRRFAVPERLSFALDPHGLPVAFISCRTGAAAVSLYGAHVLGYRATGRDAALFLSEHSEYTCGKPIRGGIPLCWPWFGPNPADPDAPMHGIARISLWEVADASTADDSVELVLALKDSDATRALWQHAFDLRLHIRVGATLSLALTTTNTGDSPFTFTDAFHPYFAVREIMDAEVKGLAGAAVEDRLAKRSYTQSADPLVIRSETDAIFTPASPSVALLENGRPRLTVAFKGTDRLVVWNPWIDKSHRLEDFGDNEFRRMICLEPANVGPAAVTMQPKACHTLAMQIIPQ